MMLQKACVLFICDANVDDDGVVRVFLGINTFRTKCHGKRVFRQRSIPIRKVGRRTNAKVNPALSLTVRDNPLVLMGLRRAQ